MDEDMKEMVDNMLQVSSYSLEKSVELAPNYAKMFRAIYVELCDIGFSPEESLRITERLQMVPNNK